MRRSVCTDVGSFSRHESWLIGVSPLLDRDLFATIRMPRESQRILEGCRTGPRLLTLVVGDRKSAWDSTVWLLKRGFLQLSQSPVGAASTV